MNAHPSPRDLANTFSPIILWWSMYHVQLGKFFRAFEMNMRQQVISRQKTGL